MGETCYKGFVKINSEDKQLEASLKVEYCNKQEVTKFLEFVIYDNSSIKVTGDKIETVQILENIEISPFILGRKLIRIELKERIEIGEMVELNFDYILNFDKFEVDFMNSFETQYVELGLYTPWYPLNTNFEECLYDIEFCVQKEQYVVGAKALESGNWQLIQEEYPHCGIEFIIGSNKYNKHISKDKAEINIHWFNDEDANIGKYLYSNIAQAITLFTGIFGKSGKSNLNIALVPRKNSERSGGYCRPNLIVIPMGENKHNNGRYSEDKKTYILEYMLHEVAHLWWSKANCQSFEDWLNEGFAEYSKYIALRELFGEEQYTELFRNLELKAETMPSLIDENIPNEERFELMRVKGPVVLYKLEQKVGKIQMNNFLEEVHQKKANTTQGILDIIENRYSRDTALFFKAII